VPHDAKNLYSPFSLQKFNCGCGGARILSLFVSHRAPKAEICNKELGIQETAKKENDPCQLPTEITMSWRNASRINSLTMMSDSFCNLSAKDFASEV
jgi:hypothetical protein